MNGKLMGKMKELNIVLERALEKANQKKLAKLNKDGNSRVRDKSHQIQVKQNELQNTQVQITKNNKEISELKRRLNQISGAQQIIELEEQVKLIKDQKVAWEKKLKDIELKVKESGKLLHQMENDEDFILKYKSLVEELRVWKDKVRRSEEQREKDLRTKANQLQLLEQLQQENSVLKEKIEKVRRDKNLPDLNENNEGQVEMVTPTDEDMMKLEHARDALERKIREQDRTHRKELKGWKDNISAQEAKIEELKKVVKEKE